MQCFLLYGNRCKICSIGFDNNANLLEIMYNVIDDQTVRVFHAMKCTNEHRKLLAIQEKKFMPDMTDEEYDALDEYYTKNPPKLSGDGKSGFFAKHSEKGDKLIFIDDLSANWLRIKAAAAGTTPEAIIGELVRKEIAAAV